MINIFEPTPTSPYVFSANPITLRTACSAGFNRSATVRELISRNIHPHSIVYPQYGALYGDYNSDEIGCIVTNLKDGFIEVFGTLKSPSVQEIIFKDIGYKIQNHPELQYIKKNHHDRYRHNICQRFLNFDNSNKNVFVLINEDETVIDNTIKMLEEHLGKNHVDLVIIRCPDIILYPRDSNIKPQSSSAYRKFVSTVRSYFRFNYTFS
jgi:hypothetical protein